MPLYEYKCAKCDSVFEVIQKFVDDPLGVHPGCGGTVERLFSTPSFQFKGSGFYITDYGKAGSADGKSDKSDKAEKAKDSGDSKPAAPAAAPAASTTSSDSSAKRS